MSREFSRTDRVGQQIHKEVASILQNEFKNRDPRLGFVTVSGAEISRDLAHAKVFVTFFSEDENKIKEDLHILEDNKGFVRNLLSKRIRMRSVPTIHFVRDPSITEGMRISNIVSQTVRDDAEKAKQSGRELNADTDTDPKELT